MYKRQVLSLDELIGNLQTYELRRNSQQQEETMKDRGLALKIMEEDSSDLDEEDMAMFSRKFKKFVKKTKAGQRLILWCCLRLCLIRVIS